MTGPERLKECFTSGGLVRPSSEALNFLDLTRALASQGGVSGMPAGPGGDTILRIGDPVDRCLFVLLDGMGMDQLGRLPGGSFLRSSPTIALQAVFPSATATALTTLGTGQWPSAHGIPGWWTYLEDRDVSAVTLHFRERTTERPLNDLALSPRDLFPVPSFWPGLKGSPVSILPAGIMDTVYSVFIRGGTPRLGYRDLAEAFKTAAGAVLGAASGGLVYLYIPHLDTLCHKRGTDDKRGLDLLLTLDRHLGKLSESLGGRARIMISADHGQINVPERHRFVISEGDSILAKLRCLPSGEPNVPVFHVLKGMEAGFAAEFMDRFGEVFILLTPEEVEEMRLLGPDPVSRTMRARLGTFVGISLEPAALCVGPPEVSGAHHIGFHGGLTAAEMHIPLIVPEP